MKIFVYHTKGAPRDFTMKAETQKEKEFLTRLIKHRDSVGRMIIHHWTRKSMDDDEVISVNFVSIEQ